MVLNTERKFLCGILGLAVLGLGVDSLLGGGLTGPASADASTPGSSMTSMLTDLMTAIADGEASMAEPVSFEPAASAVVAGRLESVTDGIGLRLDPDALADRFQPDASWFEDPTPAQVEAAPTLHPQPLAPIGDRFASDHAVTAVMRGATSGAIVNGGFLKVGETTDAGATLVNVPDRSTAVFELDGETVTIVIDD